MSQRPLSQLFFASAALVTAFLAITCVIFLFNLKSGTPYGVYGVKSFGRLVASENAKENQYLFEINDTYAYVITSSTVSAVKYEKSHYPLCMFCGTYVLAGDSVNLPIQQDHYLFSQYTNADNRFAILNLNTGAYTTVVKLSDFSEARLDPAQGHVVTLDDASKDHVQLSLQKESCLVITVAELIVIIGSLLLGGMFKIRERRNRTA